MKRKQIFRRRNFTLELTRSNSEICLISEMKINGIDAYIFDFGTMKDMNPELAPPSGCGNRCFIPKPFVAPQLLEKYNISKEDGQELLELLQKELHVGLCKRCR